MKNILTILLFALVTSLSLAQTKSSDLVPPAQQSVVLTLLTNGVPLDSSVAKIESMAKQYEVLANHEQALANIINTENARIVFGARRDMFLMAKYVLEQWAEIKKAEAAKLSMPESATN